MYNIDFYIIFQTLTTIININKIKYGKGENHAKSYIVIINKIKIMNLNNKQQQQQ